MTLNGERLGNEIFNALEALPVPQNREMTDNERKEYWLTVGIKIVAEFVNNAIISVNNTGQATGVQTGGGVAPTTGTGTGEIS